VTKLWDHHETDYWRSTALPEARQKDRQKEEKRKEKRDSQI
jgi:hypothetical protein